MKQMDCEDALRALEKDSGLILACQPWPQSNVVIPESVMHKLTAEISVE